MHAIPAELAAIYTSKGYDLVGGNAQEPDALTLPLPATYVIGRDGTIVFAAVDADYTQRADPDDVLAAAVAIA